MIRIRTLYLLAGIALLAGCSLPAATSIPPTWTTTPSITIPRNTARTTQTRAPTATFPPRAATPFPAGSLVVYYPFDNNATDASGHDHDGQAFGPAMAPDRLGMRRSAFQFDGNLDYISVLRRTGLGLTGDLSVGLWMDASQSDGWGTILLALAPTSANEVEGWQIAFANQSSGGLAIFDPISQNDGGTYMSTSPIPFSKWTCLVFTYHDADGAWTWYVNGVADNQGQHTIDLSSTSASLYIGGFPPSTIDGRSFRGSLDDIAVYERTLKPEEANAFCAGRSGTALISPAAPTSSSTIRRTSTATPTIRRSATPTVQRTPGCDGGFSRLAVGGYAILTEGTAPNRVRSEPELADDNIISLLYTGATVKILGGPVCVGQWIFWKVESSTIPGGSGWTAEGNGREYFLAPYEP